MHGKLSCFLRAWQAVLHAACFRSKAVIAGLLSGPLQSPLCDMPSIVMKGFLQAYNVFSYLVLDLGFSPVTLSVGETVLCIKGSA